MKGIATAVLTAEQRKELYAERKRNEMISWAALGQYFAMNEIYGKEAKNLEDKNLTKEFYTGMFDTRTALLRQFKDRGFRTIAQIRKGRKETYKVRGDK